MCFLKTLLYLLLLINSLITRRPQQSEVLQMKSYARPEQESHETSVLVLCSRLPRQDSPVDQTRLFTAETKKRLTFSHWDVHRGDVFTTNEAPENRRASSCIMGYR